VPGPSTRALTVKEKRRLALLGLPTFGLALSITVVSTYLPKLAEQFTQSTTAIGAVVGGEGVMALWVPLVVGPWSDQLRTRFGGRLPFLMAAAPVMSTSLVAIGVSRSFGAIALSAAFFFFAYFVAYEPYRALYPDLLDDEIAGRAQGTQALWRGAGSGLALLCGGLLLTGGRGLPFAAAAAIVTATTGAFCWLVLREGLKREEGKHGQAGLGDHARRLRQLIADHPALRNYLVANALWEMALAALKAFVILYLTEGLGVSLGLASLLVGGAGVVVFLGAALAGRLGDRLGRLRVTRWALWVYGLGFLIPLLITFKPAVAIAVPGIALGGGTVMALAYAVLVPLMPEAERGALTGFYSLSRGIGITLGPLLAGGLISASSNLFTETHGFQAMWAVPCAAILASIPFTGRLRDADEDRHELREA
jgi:MFS family permease